MPIYRKEGEQDFVFAFAVRTHYPLLSTKTTH